MSLTLERAIELETAVWEALKSGDRVADEAHLAPDFLGVYPSGFATRADHIDQLADGPSIATYRIADARLDVIAEDAFLIAYRAVFSRAATPDRKETMFVSSLWRRRNDAWLNTFSQDTPVGAGG